MGVDLAPIEPPLELANVISILADVSEESALKGILDALGGPADVLLSDAAPKLTGVRATDRAREEALLEAVGALVPRVLRPGGSLVLKLFDGPEADAFARALRGRFERGTGVRPDASRKGTSERYWLGFGYRGGDTD